MILRFLILFFPFYFGLFPLKGQSPGLTFGGLKNENGVSIDIAKDSGYIIAGATRSYGAGNWDGYTIKLRKNGMFQWSKTYGWTHHDYFESVLSLDDGYLFVGHVWDYGQGGRDIYLLKTDLLGNIIFDHFYGTHLKDMGFDVATSKNGGFLIIGYSRGEELRGDIFMLKVDENGNEIWRNNFGTTYDDYAYSFVENTDGTILIFGSVGSFYNDIHYTYKASSADWILLYVDQNGLEIKRKTYTARGHDFAQKILTDPNGGYYLFGSSMSYGHGSFDMLLMKTDDDGNKIWQKSFGGEKYDYGMSMDINKVGDIYLFGTTKSFGQDESADFFLVKTNEHGDEMWILTIGGSDLDYGYDIKTTPDNGCILLGQTKSFGSGGFDMMMVKVDKDGMIEQLIDGLDTLTYDKNVVYPNPLRSSGRLIPPDFNFEYTMEIVSLRGSTVQSYTLKSPNYRFSVETLPAGLYIYRISKKGDEKYIFKGKLLVQ